MVRLRSEPITPIAAGPRPRTREAGTGRGAATSTATPARIARQAPGGVLGAVLVVAGLALGCATPRRDPPPPPGPAPEVGQVTVDVEPLIVTWREPDRALAARMGPSEPGFTFCCGERELKMEIDCSEMIKRCYERADSGWRATYGRHCKRALGEACYLELCDARCR
jgi:hypothetical protein